MYTKAPNGANVSRDKSISYVVQKREDRAKKTLLFLDNFRSLVDFAIAEAEKKGLLEIKITRHPLIREIEGDADSHTCEYFFFPCLYLVQGRKPYNEIEVELLQKEKNILQELRNDGYNVKISGPDVIITW